MRKPIEAAGAAFCLLQRLLTRVTPFPQGRRTIRQRFGFFAQVLVDTTLALDNARFLSDMRALAPDCIVADSMALWGKLIAKAGHSVRVLHNDVRLQHRYSAKIAEA